MEEGIEEQCWGYLNTHFLDIFHNKMKFIIHAVKWFRAPCRFIYMFGRCRLNFHMEVALSPVLLPAFFLRQH